MLGGELGVRQDVGIGVTCIIALLIVAIFSLGGCASNQQTENSTDVGSTDVGSTDVGSTDVGSTDAGSADDADAAVDDNFDEYNEYSYTLDDVSDMQGVYVLSSSENSFKPVYTTNQVAINLGYDEENFDYYYDYERAVHLYEYGEPVVVDRTNGEQLVIAGSGDSSLFSIEDSNFLYKVTYSGFYQGAGAAGDIDDYEEVDGEETDSGSFDISSHGIEMHSISGQYDVVSMMTSPTELHVDAGWYEGSSWVDGAINLDVPYYIVYQERDTIKPVVEPTKNGYFLINISNLEKGIYIFQSYYLDGDSYYLFEVV